MSKLYDIEYPLSNNDIDKYIKQICHNGINLVQANEFTPNADIDKLFNNGGHCTIFSPNKTSSIGHWLTMLRNTNGEYAFIDSYGMKPDTYNKNYIKCLKNNASVGKGNVKSLFVNDTKLQSDDHNISTCGRYNIVFIALNKMNIPYDKMIEILKNASVDGNTTPDNIVLNITKEI